MKTKNRRVKLPQKVFTAKAVPPPEQQVMPHVHEPRGPPPLPMLMSIPEVARELGLSERTIQAYLEQGVLERVKLGTRTVRIARASLLKLIGEAAE